MGMEGPGRGAPTCPMVSGGARYRPPAAGSARSVPPPGARCRRSRGSRREGRDRCRRALLPPPGGVTAAPPPREPRPGPAAAGRWLPGSGGVQRPGSSGAPQAEPAAPRLCLPRCLPHPRGDSDGTGEKETGRTGRKPKPGNRPPVPGAELRPRSPLAAPAWLGRGERSLRAPGPAAPLPGLPRGPPVPPGPQRPVGAPRPQPGLAPAAQRYRGSPGPALGRSVLGAGGSPPALPGASCPLLPGDLPLLSAAPGDVRWRRG